MKIVWSMRLYLFCSFALFAGAARAQLEGTLFTKPEEREYLDYLRAEFLRTSAVDDFNIEEADIPEIPVAVAESTGPVEFSFGGAVARRDGIRIWLNGKLLAEPELPEGFSIVESGRNVSLRIVANGSTYVLLPGQTVDLTAGTVIETFQRPQPVSAATAPAAEAQPAATPAVTVAEAPQTAPEEAATIPGDVDPAVGPAESLEPATDTDALAAAAAALDDSEVDDLFEILENRRLERTAGAGSNEEANSEDP